jgi:23S rRNA A2030 N6-methylase RlmJ
MSLCHVVLISFKPFNPDATDWMRKDVYDRYQTIAEECGGVDAGILFFAVERNLDLRKGVDLVEVALFRDNDALQAFRVHPKHQELTDVLRQCANWQVGDIDGLPLQKIPSPLQPKDFGLMQFDPRN